MINIIRRIFGTKITVIQEHINRREQLGSDFDPVSLAIQEHLTEKYGMVAQKSETGIWNLIPRRQICTTILHFVIRKNNKFGKTYSIPTNVPYSVYNFLLSWDCYGEGKPFSFYYIV
jgi:hypothetical protein